MPAWWGYLPNRIEAGRARACRSPSDHVGKSVLLPRTRKPASECRNADKTVVNNLDNLKLYHKIKWDLKSPYEETVNYSNQQGSANRKGEKREESVKWNMRHTKQYAINHSVSEAGLSQGGRQERMSDPRRC